MVIEWSPRAQSDLADIWGYYSPLNAKAAAKIVSEIRASVRLLADFPLLAPRELLLEGHTFEYRSLVVVKRYKAMYRIDGEKIIIVTLHDCRRDPVKLRETVNP